MSPNRRAVMAVAAASAFAPLVAKAATPKTPSAADMIALQDRFLALMTGTDMDALAAMMSEKLTYIHPNGMVNTKKIQMDGMIAGPKPRYTKLEQKNTTVKAYPGFAVLTGDIFYTALPRNGQLPPPTSYRLSSVWADEGGTWRLINWQQTTIPAPRPAADGAAAPAAGAPAAR